MTFASEGPGLHVKVIARGGEGGSAHLTQLNLNLLLLLKPSEDFIAAIGGLAVAMCLMYTEACVTGQGVPEQGEGEVRSQGRSGAPGYVWGQMCGERWRWQGPDPNRPPFSKWLQA